MLVLGIAAMPEPASHNGGRRAFKELTGRLNCFMEILQFTFPHPTRGPGGKNPFIGLARCPALAKAIKGALPARATYDLNQSIKLHLCFDAIPASSLGFPPVAIPRCWAEEGVSADGPWMRG